MEWGLFTSVGPDGTPIGAPSLITTNQRSGRGCLRITEDANDSYIVWNLPTALTTGQTLFARMYMDFEPFPVLSSGTQVAIMRMGAIGPGDLASVRLDVTTGQLTLWNDQTNTQLGTGSATITTGGYRMIELAVKIAAGAADQAILRVEGAEIQNSSGLSLSDVVPDSIAAGILYSTGSVPDTGQSWDVYLDDVAINDSSGADQNTFPGPGKVLCLLPELDGVVGSWTKGAGGVGNLWDAVNNAPPIVLADLAGGSDSTQVREAAALSTLELWLQTYEELGIVGADAIKVVHPFCLTGAPSATQAKTGALGLGANPVIAQLALQLNTAQFWAGTAASSDPSIGWKVSWGTPAYNPSVRTRDPVLGRVTITGGTASRIAMVGFVGANVEILPTDVSSAWLKA